MDIPAEARKQIHLSSVFCSIRVLSGLVGAHPLSLVRVIFFAQSMDSDANLFQKHPHRHTQKYCLTKHPLAQSS